MAFRGQRLPPGLVDGALAAALTAIGLYEVGRTEAYGAEWLRALAMILVTVPLVARRSHTLAAATVSMSGLALEGLSMDGTNSLAELLTGLVFAYSIPRYLPLDRALLGIPLLVIGISVHRIATPGSGAADVIFDVAFVTAAWTLGDLSRRREDRANLLEERALELERSRAREAREAATAERLRIARELHDIVAHALGLIAVQTGAAEEVMATDPGLARETLATVRSTARESVVEMRRLLGLLRADEANALAPQPSLAQLDTLVETVRDSGVEVTLRVEGQPHDLAPGVELSAFRILQEALTNVVRHAAATRADVTVRYAPSSLDLAVIDDGAGPSDGSQSGYGLVGIRERVALHGGSLEAGPSGDGGFLLRAALPLDPGSA